MATSCYDNFGLLIGWQHGRVLRELGMLKNLIHLRPHAQEFTLFYENKVKNGLVKSGGEGRSVRFFLVPAGPYKQGNVS